MKIFVDYGGRRILSGILENGVFKKSVETRQKLRVMDSYGIDVENATELEKLGCRRIELIERDTGNIYSIDFDTFLQKSVPRQIGKFGVRKYLPLKYWEKEEGIKKDNQTAFQF